MEQLNPRPDRSGVMPAGERAPRRISPEQLAAVSRLQAYWMARVGLRAAAAANNAEQPVDHDDSTAAPR